MIAFVCRKEVPAVRLFGHLDIAQLAFVIRPLFVFGCVALPQTTLLVGPVKIAAINEEGVGRLRISSGNGRGGSATFRVVVVRLSTASFSVIQGFFEGRLLLISKSSVLRVL